VSYRRRKGHQITVVFDGWKDGRGVETSSVSGGVRIIYSSLGEKADSVIRRIVSTERHEWVVVSSDREIASHAWSMNSVPVPSEEFLSLLEARDAEGVGDADRHGQEEEDDGEKQYMRKGSSHKQSKKEKALQRVLGRL
jgi:predicted RNA-binding protein with PIN domain